MAASDIMPLTHAVLSCVFVLRFCNTCYNVVLSCVWLLLLQLFMDSLHYQLLIYLVSTERNVNCVKLNV